MVRPVFLCLFAAVLGGSAPAFAADRPRVVVLTDISNEPDDEESLVRFLVYANEYDVEGLVATTSCWLRDTTRADLLLRDIEAYGRVRPNLLAHAPGFPEAAALEKVVKRGQPRYGMAAVGSGRSTEGSRLIVEAGDRPDGRPLWVAAWGGTNTLAQALWDVKYSRSAEETERFVSRLRVYSISDQDDAGRWLRITFPGLSYIVSPSAVDWKEYHQATWSGISGDRHYQNGPGHRFEMVDNPWLEENVIRNHGPLGALYPRLAYIMEGDTPSFLNLIGNGLCGGEDPSYGGWGGRYALFQSYAETRPIWTNSRDRVRAEDGSWHVTAQATVWRWREAFQNDFAGRMDWCAAESYSGANHHPAAVLNGIAGRDAVRLSAKPGETVRLSSAGSSDPDGNRIGAAWFQYPEAGTWEGEIRLSSSSGPATSFTAPEVKEPRTLHVILEIKDNGKPPLVSYRRAVIEVKP